MADAHLNARRVLRAERWVGQVDRHSGLASSDQSHVIELGGCGSFEGAAPRDVCISHMGCARTVIKVQADTGRPLAEARPPQLRGSSIERDEVEPDSPHQPELPTDLL